MLVFLEDKKKYRHPITKGNFVLGRHHSCDLVIDPNVLDVSNRHALLLVHEDTPVEKRYRFLVQGRNPVTYVNRKLVPCGKHVFLQSGDEIVLGKEKRGYVPEKLFFRIDYQDRTVVDKASSASDEKPKYEGYTPVPTMKYVENEEELLVVDEMTDDDFFSRANKRLQQGAEFSPVFLDEKTELDFHLSSQTAFVIALPSLETFGYEQVGEDSFKIYWQRESFYVAPADSASVFLNGVATGNSPLVTGDLLQTPEKTFYFVEGKSFLGSDKLQQGGSFIGEEQKIFKQGDFIVTGNFPRKQQELVWVTQGSEKLSILLMSVGESNRIRDIVRDLEQKIAHLPCSESVLLLDQALRSRSNQTLSALLLPATLVEVTDSSVQVHRFGGLQPLFALQEEKPQKFSLEKVSPAEVFPPIGMLDNSKSYQSATPIEQSRLFVFPHMLFVNKVSSKKLPQ